MSIAKIIYAGLFGVLLFTSGSPKLWALETQKQNSSFYTAAKIEQTNVSSHLNSHLAQDTNSILSKVLADGSFNYKGIISGYLNKGWNKRKGKGPKTAAITGPTTLESQILWRPNQISKFAFDISHGALASDQLKFGLTRTKTGLEYNHKIQEGLILKLIGSYKSKNYSNSLHEKTILKTGIKINYTITPKLKLGGEYSFIRQNRSVDQLEFKDNVLMLRTRYKW